MMRVLGYVLAYLVVFGAFLVLFAPMMGMSRPTVLFLALLAVVMGAVHGAKKAGLIGP